MSPVMKTIIVVEDEPDTAEMFAEMMRLSGFQAIKSFGGKQALHLISREKPDAILLDIMMPDISGLDVLRFIRRDPRLENIPVIIVSAKSMPADIQSGMEAGADLYLTKPVGFTDLRSAVERVMVDPRAATAI